MSISLKSISEKYQEKISVVIPVYNEQDNILPLAKELHTVLEPLPYDYEIIFVDDGSLDHTYAGTTVCSKGGLPPNDHPVQKKLWSRHPLFLPAFPTLPASILSVWMVICKNDPQDIPKLLKAIEKKYDAVCGWRKRRHDPTSKRFISKGFNLFCYLLLGDLVHDASCSFKIFRSKAVKSLLPLRSKNHNCLTSMLHLRGYKVGETIVTHRPRTRGETKYRNPLRVFRIFWMLVYIRFWWCYTHQPQKRNFLDFSQIREIVKP